MEAENRYYGYTAIHDHRRHFEFLHLSVIKYNASSHSVHPVFDDVFFDIFNVQYLMMIPHI